MLRKKGLNGEGFRLKKDAMTRMVVSSTNDGQFENVLCLAIGATPSLASDMPTPFYPPFLQNLAIEILDELVKPGLHKMDMRNKDEVIMRMKPAITSKQFGQEDIICSLTADCEHPLNCCLMPLLLLLLGSLVVYHPYHDFFVYLTDHPKVLLLDPFESVHLEVEGLVGNIDWEMLR
ncbi:hypothetical protein Cgig2_023117 [Carnegiea gigantea]|uniref:Uncharacterized protein n=1 Tax=Carnegiea gigantea TaxID=171969 RepID=A0A9Q1GJJ8_9CARY|nr:hypothetical protein Cgig2_023117 [Carnegiea gigantea]